MRACERDEDVERLERVDDLLAFVLAVDLGAFDLAVDLGVERSRREVARVTGCVFPALALTRARPI